MSNLARFEDLVEQRALAALSKETRNARWAPSTYRRTQEVETKLDLSDLPMASDLLEAVAAAGVLSWNIRDERHCLYAKPSDSRSVCVINVLRPPRLWVKVKCGARRVESARELPFIVRHGNKLDCSRAAESEVRRHLAGLDVVAEYDKKCINVFFPHRRSIFSMSFSLARTAAGLTHFQAEFEYEACMDTWVCPSVDEVLTRTDELFLDMLPAYEGLLNATSKLDFFRQQAPCYDTRQVCWE